MEKFIPVLFRGLGTLSAIIFGRFLGSEGTLLMPTGPQVMFLIILFLSLICLFPLLCMHLNKKYKFLLFFFIIFLSFWFAFFFYHIKIQIISWISGCLSTLMIFYASGGEIVPYFSPSPASSEDSFELRVLAEPWPVIPNLGFESSMQGRILVLENANSIFLLDKAKGVYWAEIKEALLQAPSQKDYNRLLDFENRDLQIREKKTECYALFQEILSRNPSLAENAAYIPKETFLDFFAEKRDELDTNAEWSPAEKDGREIQLVHLVKEDLRRRGPQSVYMRQLLGNGT